MIEQVAVGQDHRHPAEGEMRQDAPQGADLETGTARSPGVTLPSRRVEGGMVGIARGVRAMNEGHDLRLPW